MLFTNSNPSCMSYIAQLQEDYNKHKFLCDSIQTEITDYIVQIYNKYNLLITTKAYWHFYNKPEHMLAAHSLK
jgi:hypothetical protein